MNKDELKQYLESRRRNLSEKQFFELILTMLENDLSEESRDVLRAKLVAYSAVDENRAALYWKQCLSDSNPLQREFAALQLAMMAKGPNSLAHQILTEYLGQEPAENGEIDIIIERFSKLFPPGTAEE
jgi:hypothetical protein